MATQCFCPCKLTISLQLFTRWRCCSGITKSSYLFARRHLFEHVGYFRHQQKVDLWSWNWCPSHVWRGLPLCHFSVFLGLSVLVLGPMYATDRETDIRQNQGWIKALRGHRPIPNSSGAIYTRGWEKLAIFDRNRRLSLKRSEIGQVTIQNIF